MGRNLLNRAAIISSTPVLTEAAAHAGKGSDVDLVRRRVTVATSDTADVITVRALDPTPAGAARLANSVITAYMTVIDRTSRQRAAAEATRLKAQEGTLNQRIQALQAQVANAPDDKALQTDLAAATAELQSLVTQELKATAQVDQASDVVGLRPEVRRSWAHGSASRAGCPGMPWRVARLCGIGAEQYLLNS